MQLDVDNCVVEDTGALDDANRQLIAMIQNGVPVTERPYEKIARQLGVSEDEIVTRIAALLDSGVIKRFGVVVRHHELGYRENAMVVWDVPDNQVHSIARQIKSYSFVTLCYRRARQLPEWPYNLFCMIHGKSRDQVMRYLEEMIDTHNWHDYPRDVLFSKRRFKQSAANYLPCSDPE